MKIKFLLLMSVLAAVTVNAHEGAVHKAPITACAGAEISPSCSYKHGHGDLDVGSCQSFNSLVMCVRNKPIIRAEDIQSKAELKGSKLFQVTPKI